MKEIMDYLEKLFSSINTPVAILIIFILFRKSLGLFLAALTKKVERPGEVSIGKDGVSIKEYIKDELSKKQDETLGMIEKGVGKTTPVAQMENTDLHLRTIASLIPENLGEFKENVFKKIGEKKQQPADDDPLKSEWADFSNESKNRKVSAVVEPIPNTKLYKIKILVESTSPVSDPLRGKVKFFLHPSFIQNKPVIDVKDGKAELRLVSYGSFTLGAETDDGRKLKLDLARDVPGVSEEFKNT